MYREKKVNNATNENVTEQKRIDPPSNGKVTYIQKLELAVCQKYHDRTCANAQEM